MYSVFITDDINYTHIISAVISGIILMIIGYQFYIGIDFLYDSTVNTYQYNWLGLLFVVGGTIMILYGILQGINVNVKLIGELEGNEIYDPNKKSKDIYNR